MKKCDFCVASEPNGKCHWELYGNREKYCEKAIKLMVEAMKGSKQK